MSEESKDKSKFNPFSFANMLSGFGFDPVRAMQFTNEILVRSNTLEGQKSLEIMASLFSKFTDFASTPAGQVFVSQTAETTKKMMDFFMTPAGQKLSIAMTDMSESFLKSAQGQAMSEAYASMIKAAAEGTNLAVENVKIADKYVKDSFATAKESFSNAAITGYSMTEAETLLNEWNKKDKPLNANDEEFKSMLEKSATSIEEKLSNLGLAGAITHTDMVGRIRKEVMKLENPDLHKSDKQGHKID